MAKAKGTKRTGAKTTGATAKVADLKPKKDPKGGIVMSIKRAR